jgi:hypothetical protein
MMKKLLLLLVVNCCFLFSVNPLMAEDECPDASSGSLNAKEIIILLPDDRDETNAILSAKLQFLKCEKKKCNGGNGTCRRFGNPEWVSKDNNNEEKAEKITTMKWKKQQQWKVTLSSPKGFGFPCECLGGTCKVARIGRLEDQKGDCNDCKDARVDHHEVLRAVQHCRDLGLPENCDLRALRSGKRACMRVTRAVCRDGTYDFPDHPYKSYGEDVVECDNTVTIVE